jgi:hypothetical protein
MSLSYITRTSASAGPSRRRRQRLGRRRLVRRLEGGRHGFVEGEVYDGHVDALVHVLGRVAQGRHLPVTYSDEKGANRDIRVWHGATENGP